MKPRKGCWTCTARKIQCDGGRPMCSRCTRSKLTCQGYEPRLSWPRNSDEKRAILCDSSTLLALPSRKAGEAPRTPFFINTTFQDVELYDFLSFRAHPNRVALSSSNLLKQPGIYANQNELFQYFHDLAHLSLVTFGVTSSQIRDTLMSMAIASNTMSGLALLHAILAYSSLHHYGLSEQAVRLKIQALHYLSTSAQDGQISTASASQLVATSMLLGSFETLRPSESSGEWLWHVSGAMDVIQATQLDALSHNSDTYYLLDWANYHYTLSRFSEQYWRHKSSGDRLSLSLTKYKPNIPSVHPSYAILNLLSEVSDTLVNSQGLKSRSLEYNSSLENLEARLVDIEAAPIPDDLKTASAFAIELYRVATRIYMARVSDNLWDAPSILDDVINALFNGPVKTCTCEHFFPLLILACESRRDDQRLAILNLIDRTQRDARIRSIKGVTDAIHAIWVHQDLHADSDLLVNYLDLLSIGISASSTIPSLA